MGAWGGGLYAGDFALDLRGTIAAVVRLPLDEEGLVEAICQTQPAAAADPADADHTIFWLVLADQFEKRGLFSRRVRETALAIIDGGKDAAAMQALGMKAGDSRRRAANLDELRRRLQSQPETSKPRQTLRQPQPYVFEQYGVYAYPTGGGKPINPYLTAKYFDRAQWRPDGFGLLLVVGRGRAFDYLAWYHAVKADAVVTALPDRARLVESIRWTAPPAYGTCSPGHFRKMELAEIGVFPLDPTRIDHFFPHLAPARWHAIADVSIANEMDMAVRKSPRVWRAPDGKLVRIVYPPAPTLRELM
jgi:hypothetical protein